MAMMSEFEEVETSLKASLSTATADFESLPSTANMDAEDASIVSQRKSFVTSLILAQGAYANFLTCLDEPAGATDDEDNGKVRLFVNVFYFLACND
jgi:hypothetical protein